MISLQAAPTQSEWTIHCWSKDSPYYPSELLNLPQQPEKLYAIGRDSALTKPRVAIVGTRNCTGYGERAARTLTRALVRAGVSVISGMARGIDSEQSRGSNQLIRDGAALIASADDALALLGVSGPKEKAPPPLLPDSEQKVWDAIEGGLVQSDFLPSATGLTLAECLAAITSLEI